jgi:hypothetical protein
MNADFQDKKIAPELKEGQSPIDLLPKILILLFLRLSAKICVPCLLNKAER